MIVAANPVQIEASGLERLITNHTEDPIRHRVPIDGEGAIVFDAMYDQSDASQTGRVEIDMEEGQVMIERAEPETKLQVKILLAELTPVFLDPVDELILVRAKKSGYWDIDNKDGNIQVKFGVQRLVTELCAAMKRKQV